MKRVEDIDSDEKGVLTRPLLEAADHEIDIENNRKIEFKNGDLLRVCATNPKIRDFLLENFTSQGIVKIEDEYKEVKKNIEKIKITPSL